MRAVGGRWVYVDHLNRGTDARRRAHWCPALFLPDVARDIDSTGLRLSGISGNWASLSDGVCGAKAHIVYDPDADQPLDAAITPANVNDITAAKQMPIEPGAIYVFDLGYDDFGGWAKLHNANCRIVTA